MKTSNRKSIQGVSNIYDSTKAKDFDKPQNYPLAWEIMFVNDKAGKEFSLNAIKAFSELPKEKGYILAFQGDHKAPARCLECVFKNKDTFRKILNETLKGISFYDEKTSKIIPKTIMLKDAGKLLTSKMSMAI